MQVTARVPGLDNQAFALGIPETIGCREAMLVNFPEARVKWQGPDAEGVVSCSWGPGGRIFYTLRLLPTADYVDVEMTVRNHTEFLWHDVFAFNCLNPIEARAFQDWKLERTYMSAQGKPRCLAQTTRVKGHMPTVGFYLPERVAVGTESVFVRGFGATSPDRTDGPWIVTLAEPAGAYMAATAMEAAFLFDNLDRCCLHAAPSFGDIGPGEGSTTVSRLYLAKGTLDDFLRRLAADRPGLTARQKWARSVGAARGTKPHGRMEEMSPDELEAVLAEAPVAFVPLGTYEHHGFHLPVCFDGIKAHAFCERVARQTGGTVLPTFFYGTGGGHIGYKWTLENRVGAATGQDIGEVEHAGPAQNCRRAAASLNCRAAQPRLPQSVERHQEIDGPPMEVLQLYAGTRQKLADVKSRPVDRGKRSKSHRLPQEPEEPLLQNH